MYTAKANTQNLVTTPADTVSTGTDGRDVTSQTELTTFSTNAATSSYAQTVPSLVTTRAMSQPEDDTTGDEQGGSFSYFTSL